MYVNRKLFFFAKKTKIIDIIYEKESKKQVRVYYRALACVY